VAEFENFWDDSDELRVTDDRRDVELDDTAIPMYTPRKVTKSSRMSKVSTPLCTPRKRPAETRAALSEHSHTSRASTTLCSPRKRAAERRPEVFEPLQVFKVDTPPGSPRQLTPERRPTFVPPWPYSSKWPFNCAPTTLELRGLPKGCTAETIIRQLDAWGFHGKYDLVCTDKTGLAIVNASRYADGCGMAGRLHNFSDWKVESGTRRQGVKCKRKACRVSWSFTCQGLGALVQEYHNDTGASWYSSDGEYEGPWILHCDAWWPLFSPVHLWPVSLPVSAAVNSWQA
jgi:hypothetical protein